MLTLSPRQIAQILGGDVQANGAIVPAPGHSPKDRSLSISLSPTARDGFVVYCHSPGADPLACKDYVRQKLGLGPWRPSSQAPEMSRGFRTAAPPPDHMPTSAVDLDSERRKRRATALWQEAREPRGTPVDRYLLTRCIELPADIAGPVLRFHNACPWRGDDGVILHVPAMIAAMRSIVTDELTGIHRTALTRDGVKIGRRMLGIAAGAAIKLDADDAVTHGLTIGEGIETTQAARQLGLKPAWALGSVGGIAGFPVLAGIECLTILAERNDDGSPNAASERAVAECGQRWHEAGREVVVVDPPRGDVNDVLRAAP